MKYLQRIGITEEDARKWLILESKNLNIHDLQQLYTHHIRTVPFENLDRHTHLCHKEETIEIQRLSNDDLPSLDVRKSLQKICINIIVEDFASIKYIFCMVATVAWVSFRLALADVGCSQVIPAHAVILVGGLLPKGDGTSSSVFVDVGFGTFTLVTSLEYKMWYSLYYTTNQSWI